MKVRVVPANGEAREFFDVRNVELDNGYLVITAEQSTVFIPMDSVERIQMEGIDGNDCA